jgi:hypothetical protein
MMPGSPALPRIVCVLPEEVWPYAKTVPLKPATTCRISGCAMVS